jgi:foldase protein PrsA
MRPFSLSMTLAAAIALALGTSASWAAGPELKPDQPVAKVNDKPVTVADLQRECLARFGAGTLGQMIDYMIVDEAAQKRKIEVTPQEIVERLREFQAGVQAGLAQSRMSFADFLTARRLSMRELVAQVRMELLLGKMVGDQVTVTNDEVSKYYEANRDKFKQTERMLISHIAVEKKEDADKVRQDIVAEKITFADAARKYSIDPYGRENGGVFGWITRGGDPIQQAAFALQKDGDIAAVVQGQKGFEIVRRDAYQSERIVPFEEVQDKVKEAIRRDRTKRLAEEMMGELRRATNVEQLLDFSTLNADVQQIIEAAQKTAQPAGGGGGAAPPKPGG